MLNSCTNHPVACQRLVKQLLEHARLQGRDDIHDPPSCVLEQSLAVAWYVAVVMPCNRLQLDMQS